MGFKPGRPPANEPSAFAFLTDNRLVQNGNITRYPTNQRMWNSFIQELNKWIKNETGNFDPTFTGFSTDPSTANVWWHRYGQFVHMEFGFTTGTSDATTFSIDDVPEVIRPRDNQTCLTGGMVDNNVSITANTACEVKSTGVISFYSNDTGGGWTGSGTKGISGGLTQSIIYSLRQPGKH